MKIKSYTLILLLLAQTLLYQVSLPRLVLCIGDDGHVAIEEADTAVDCFMHPPEAGHSAYAPNLVRAIHPATDPCVDIVLDWHLSMAQYKHDSPQVTKIPYVVLSLAPATDNSIKLNIINRDDQSAIRTSGTLIARSIILLI